MSSAIRILLVLTLLLPVVADLSAQEAATTTDTTTTSATTTSATTTATTTTTTGAAEAVESDTSGYAVRKQFNNIISNSTPELTSILALEPSLLSNDAFIAQYPELAAFIAKHPEIKSHGRFFMSDFVIERNDGVDRILEPIEIFSVFLLIFFALMWLVRTIIEQRRWSRLSRTQTEVHTKILDRFGTTAELLEYIKTPAGTKFLESAPIPLHVEQSGTPRNMPFARVLWSIQVGVVAAMGGLGMLLVSTRHSGENGQALFALGAIALSIGAGFIGSAVVTIVLSRRLGILEKPADDGELVR